MFKKMRFKVNSPEHSAQIQKALFSLGYNWQYSPNEITHTSKPSLYGDEYGRIMCGSHQDTFDNSTDYKICKIEIVENYRIVEEEPEVELVELNGRKYRKEDLEKALDALTPVE